MTVHIYSCKLVTLKPRSYGVELPLSVKPKPRHLAAVPLAGKLSIR